MEKYQIDVTVDAKVDLKFYAVFEQRVITAGIRVHLAVQPALATKNRKPLRSHPIASWELRIGKYRIFYEVDEAAHVVTIVSIGHKEHNALFVRGKEVPI
jgi:mRNA-degrading endonuclease RelE of RelBE toxin-antitoxin system